MNDMIHKDNSIENKNKEPTIKISVPDIISINNSPREVSEALNDLNRE